MSEWQPPDIAPPGKHHRRVVCAAIVLGDGRMVLGPRHWDGVMHAQCPLETRKAVSFSKEKQGFIDQWGRFMNRKEAYQVARLRGKFYIQKNRHEITSSAKTFTDMNIQPTYLLTLILNGIVSQHTVTSYGSDGYTAFYVESGQRVECPGAQVSLTGNGAEFVASVCEAVVFEDGFEK